MNSKEWHLKEDKETISVTFYIERAEMVKFIELALDQMEKGAKVFYMHVVLLKKEEDKND